MTGREKCNKLKRIRAALATKLGIDLHQVECTFEGECTGTCPKCKQEEDALNGAILHKGAALAGAMMLATSMSACVPLGGKTPDPQNGGGTVEAGGNDLVGMIEYDPDANSDPVPGSDPSEGSYDVVTLSGEVDERMLNEDNTGDTSKADSKDDKVVDIDVDDVMGLVPYNG